jgi:GTP pyrophosphokinase
MVEVQVRSERMDEIAEKGYAAHYKYKNGNSEEGGLDNWLNLLKEARKFRNQRGRFCRRFQNEFVLKEIYVLHLKSKLLPKGQLIDFAFSIHSEIGIKTRNRVNWKLVPLNYELKKW